MTTDIEAFIGQEGRDKAIQEVRKQIDAEGVEYMYYQFVSVTGRIMGKGIPAAHWERIADKGFQLVYGVDGEPVHRPRGQLHRLRARGARAGRHPRARDVLRPALGHEDGARVLHAVPRPRGGGRRRRVPDLGLPRQPQAASTTSSSRDTGLHLRVGCEPEMMWLKLNPDGTPSVEGKTKPYCYHIDQFSELQPIIHKVMEYGKAMGLDMIQGDHEDAPGQLELNFMFDRAESTADRLTTYRQICRQVGREMGAFACFMPKPFMGVSANGCHHNISLWQGDENMFLPDGDNPRMPGKIGLHAIGGVLEHLGALTASPRRR